MPMITHTPAKAIHMWDDFIFRAFLAGIGIAAVAGIMGCFVVWRKMAYFGDSLSHSALLGIAFGFATGIHLNLAVTLISLIFAFILVWLQHRKLLANDTLLGILAHSALSIGMVIISLLQIRFDLHAYLFGDVLTVTIQELIWIYTGGAIVLGLLLYHWSSLVLVTLHQDLAEAEGVNALYMNLLFIFLMTLVVALSIRIVGILLITSMLIIPAASARQFAKSPESMGLIATLLAMVAVMGGLSGSLLLDIPTSPAIISLSASLFFIITLVKVLFKN